MTGRGTHTRTLQRAVDTVGGVEMLAEELKVAPQDLLRWLDGSSEPPVEAFVRALDIVAKGALHPKAERRSELARSQPADPLAKVTAIEELLRTPQIGGNVKKAVELAMSIARGAPSGAISSLAMQVVLEANRLSRHGSARRGGAAGLDEALSKLRAVLERMRPGPTA